MSPGNNALSVGAAAAAAISDGVAASGDMVPTLRPTDLRSAREAMLDTAGPIAITGAGTASRWGGTLGPVDSVLDTTALTGVIVHNPGDMTVAVRAGTPLAQLAAELAPHGQHVSLDAARVARGATVGGLLATGDAGPSALVHGSLRDLVIGITVVLADGTVAHSGGHVIKNVAGYDLSKLLHGSYGTLALLVEVVLRLHPVPRRSATVTLECPLDEAGDHATRVLASPLEPVALEWYSTGSGDAIGGSGASAGGRARPGGTAVGGGAGTEGPGGAAGAADLGYLLVRVDGTEDALPERVRRLRALLGAASEEAADNGEHRWAAHAEHVRGGPEHAVLRIGARPGLLPGLLADLPGVHSPGAMITAGLGTGVATVALPVDATGADVVARAHAAVHAAGGTSVLRDRPTSLGAPAWGPPPSAIAVLRAVKNELDPAGRLGPGRFDPWFGGSPHTTDAVDTAHPAGAIDSPDSIDRSAASSS